MPKEFMNLDGFVQNYLEQVSTMQKQITAKNQARGHDIHNFQSCGVEDFFRRYGHAFSHEPFTSHEISTIYACLPPMRFRTKECYMNAVNIASYSRKKPFTYCEGYAVGTLIPVQHAWVSLNGKPIDVTWPIDFKKLRPPKGIGKIAERVFFNQQNGSYFGIEVPLKVLTKHILEREVYCPIAEGEDFKLLREGADWLPEARP